jgi:hypothetical protein
MSVHVSFTPQESQLILEAINFYRTTKKLTDSLKKDVENIKYKINIQTGRKPKCIF